MVLLQPPTHLHKNMRHMNASISPSDFAVPDEDAILNDFLNDIFNTLYANMARSRE